jgi:hypothetical protein
MKKISPDMYDFGETSVTSVTIDATTGEPTSYTITGLTNDVFGITEDDVEYDDTRKNEITGGAKHSNFGKKCLGGLALFGVGYLILNRVGKYIKQKNQKAANTYTRRDSQTSSTTTSRRSFDDLVDEYYDEE